MFRFMKRICLPSGYMFFPFLSYSRKLSSTVFHAASPGATYLVIHSTWKVPAWSSQSIMLRPPCSRGAMAVSRATHLRILLPFFSASPFALSPVSSCGSRDQLSTSASFWTVAHILLFIGTEYNQYRSRP